MQSSPQLAFQRRPPVGGDASDVRAGRALAQKERVPVAGEGLKVHLDLERLFMNILHSGVRPELPQLALAA